MGWDGMGLGGTYVDLLLDNVGDEEVEENSDSDEEDAADSAGNSHRLASALQNPHY